jgi:hypothetical protein
MIRTASIRAAVAVCFAAFAGAASPSDNGGAGPWSNSLLGIDGLPASVRCMEVADGKGSLDIRFEGERVPLPGSNNGTAERISGVLHADGSLAATITEVDVGGGLAIRNAPDVQSRPLAVACRAAVSSVSGVAG